MNMISRAAKKKNKKSKPVQFDSDDDKVLDISTKLGSDEEEDVFGQIVSKKGKKSKSNALSFGSLEDLEEDDLGMAPAKKGKKKKNKKELPSFDALEIEEAEEPAEEVELPKEKKKSKKSKNALTFDALNEDNVDEIEDAPPQNSKAKAEEKPESVHGNKKGNKLKKEEDDLDALAALIEDSSVQLSGKGKKNKKKKPVVDEDLDALAALIEDTSVVPKTPGKGKKNKGSQSTEPTAETTTSLTEDVPEAIPEVKIKSAKQKEKERKERQKEEKRRLAAEQKAAEDAASEIISPAQESLKLDEDVSGGKGKGKGKKGKGPSAAILALRKQQEALRAAEEEAARLLEEEKRKVEEEERRLAEEERLKEEARLAKKQREQEKREQLRKEGKLLTKAQKEAKRKAELRLNALKESGMIIPALSQSSEKTDDSKPKARVFFSKKKNKAPKPDAATPAQATPVVAEEKLPEPVKDDVKESWDASDDDVKDNWDDSEASEEEKEESKEEAPAQIKGESDEEEDSEEDSDSDSDSDDESEEELTSAQRMALQKKQEAAERRQKRIAEAMAARSKDELRSPICCILGHVDTGKTKLLDKIRQTNVQEGEAGGITQQIGATYFPVENIIQKTAILGDLTEEYKLPGLLVIDTPGHESFTNLRTRGSSLCNIAILVVDLMHGLEPQTLESIRLLRDRKTPFIVALNKIDRIYDWRATPDNGFQSSFAKQPKHVREEFETRVTATITAFAEQGLNAKLYYENKNFAKYVSFVPTSAITGEGIPDLLHLLVTLTQSRLTDRLMYVSELECTVLEVKVIEGLGTTIDVVLSNGYLNEGDRIVVCGLNGPIVTQVRALLTPQPLRELRVKSAYVHHKRVKAALGIKISAPDLEKAIAGSRLLVVGPDDDEEELKDAVMEDLQTLLKSIDKSGRGVSVQASTLGSLEALLEFLRVSKIPVSAINIGPVHKKDIIRASAMLEKAKEFAVMLAFDVEVDKDAALLAEQLGVRVFTADIIYHLFDKFTAYNKDIVEQRRKEQAPSAVFPCILRMIPGAIFSRRDPIILGADVVEGTLRLGTPICVVQFDPATKKRDIVNLGVVTGIENNHKPVELVKKGMAGAGVAVKIESPPSDTPKLYGRHFTDKDEFYSRITRKSIDVLKTSFREDLSKEEWALVVKLKKILDVI
ncbi:eukaryotic translation initiation factor 5B, variant 2 [Entomophthora muscae]|nr:eukaryotic translation initiation factor 5B, variant 2 [Entomophthora muscae]